MDEELMYFKSVRTICVRMEVEESDLTNKEFVVDGERNKLDLI